MRYLKYRTGTVTILLLLFLALMSASSVLAERIPESYWGFVYLENETPSDPVTIDVYTESGEHVAHTTAPVDKRYPGSYHIIIPFKEYMSSETGLADPYERLIWKINNVTALDPRPYTDLAEPSKINSDFSLFGAEKPDITYSLTYPSSVLYGDRVTVTALFQNKAEGKAEASLRFEPSESISNLTTSSLWIEPYSHGTLNSSLVPTTCGTLAIRSEIIYTNEAGEQIGKDDRVLSFQVNGNDIGIRDVLAHPVENTSTATFDLFIKSYSSKINAINSFQLYINETFAAEVPYDIVLEPFEERMISLHFGPILFSDEDHLELRVNNATKDDECNPQNNIYTLFFDGVNAEEQSENTTEQDPATVSSQNRMTERKQQINISSPPSSPLGSTTVRTERDSLPQMLYLMFLFLILVTLFGVGVVVISRGEIQTHPSPRKGQSVKHHHNKTTRTPKQSHEKSNHSHSDQAYVILDDSHDTVIPSTIQKEAPPSQRYGHSQRPRKQTQKQSASSTMKSTQEQQHLEQDISFLEAYSQQVADNTPQQQGYETQQTDPASHFIQSDILSTQAMNSVRNSLTVPKESLAEAIEVAEYLTQAEDSTEYEGILNQLLSESDYNPTIIHLVNTALLNTSDTDSLPQQDISEETLPGNLTFNEFRQYISQRVFRNTEKEN